MSQNPYRWVTDRPPTAKDTSESAYWCVDYIDRSGPIYAMRWDDAELQEFPGKITCVIAWRPIATATKESDT
jgi:hypothetical protein